MKIKIFGKKGCAKCETTKNKFAHFIEKSESNATLEFYDMDTAGGMAEGMYYDAHKIPTSIIEKDGNVVARWMGEVPNSEEFKEYFEEAAARV